MDPVAAKPAAAQSAASQPAASESAAPAIDRNSPAYKAAQDFESVFLGEMVAQMYTGLDAKGTFSGGFAEQTYRSLRASLRLRGSSITRAPLQRS